MSGELLLELRYFRNPGDRLHLAVTGELLLDLWYFRNCPLTALCSHGVNYCLSYGTSETSARCVVSVFFSELLFELRYLRNRYARRRRARRGELLPGLPYLRNSSRTSEPVIWVNCCLVCGTSETTAPYSSGDSRVNYRLDYGTSETAASLLSPR